MIDAAVTQACVLAGFAHGRLLARDPADPVLRQSAPAVMSGAEARTRGSRVPRANTATLVAVPVGAQHVLVLEDPSAAEVSGTLLGQLAAYADFAGIAIAESTAERRLGKLAGGGLSGLVRACADLTGKVTALFDAQHRLVASAGPARIRVPSPAELGAPGEVTVVPARWGGPARRHVVAPAGNFGWLVLAEHPAVLTPFDEFVARRTAELAGTEFAIQRRVAAVAWNARSSLARQLVKGSSTVDDLRSSAEYLGVSIDVRRILAYVMHAADDERLADGVGQALGVEVLGTRGSDGVLLLIETPPEVSAVAMVGRVKAAVRRVITEDVVVGVSSVCEATALARAYREAREVAQCIDRFVGPSSPRVLAVDDLGPARLFVANSAVTAVRSYIDDVLGPLLSGDASDLLWTLQQYFECGRSVRASAVRLGVHENTVRLRLGRVRSATGFDVAADPADQLSVQTALLVLRLQGHPALPSFADGGTDQEGRKTA
ncbi:PucR family transcriptional regulator [Amycolatopsis sp. K13G38]|uniref:PucR family transcriptional regulator n=1 Tax=Amycolatopsis acididurans TaxID=2724524 RepID=A0ABX1J0J5_9PSEU|nr:helix-turn-helix domain-containing protein [Amycolatopsis acididurans]NKQ51880.1 PucR family transcriptional regulator [Amycolatopsis acididurans]